ncbi:hypothetical protein ACH5RR_033125 [Cinchona calisaya]|uniref:AAA+ ATPase domain-containing protein n=1 Tax=Cinchona calisaya TaxID=153742 RepID=A0ABD2YL85_9GENT
MASEVVSIALGTGRDLLIEEAKFLSGVSDQVKKVQEELIRMQCFLKDADRRQLKEETVRNYVREIRRLAYRTENVLDKFAIQVESRREGRGIGKAIKRSACILCEGIALHKVGLEIANIKANVNSLTTNLQTSGVMEMGIGEQNQLLLRQTYPHEVEEYFVGMKDDIKQLVSFITNEEIRSHRVISIYGMGGLGKTTLARKIYNHVDVQRAFKAFAWVSVTQQYNTRTVFRDVLKQLLPDQQKNSMEKMEDMELIVELYKFQKDTKCLVVLDDLWEIEDWKFLSRAFPFAEANSKILITTRNQKLAEVEFSYPLQFLNEDEGWELLRKRAFAKRDDKDSENDPKLEAIGREIVRKCGKLPLAISVLGGVLSQKNSLLEWETVNKDVDSYLRMSEGSKEGYGAVLQVLALSYDELPYHLKPCFLHLGNFREDEEIDVEMLYLMWIAEGMVSSDHRGTEETLTDVAERYLYEMAIRSMVQLNLDKFSTNTRVKSCYLHDLMRDFCMARGKEVEFLKLLDFREGKDPLSDTSTENLSTPARCSIHMEYSERHDLDHNDSVTRMALEANGQLRSLLISAYYRGWEVSISFPQVICDSSKFKYLRVLKLEAYVFKGYKLPRGIKNLIHLRFLSLKDSMFYKLPSSIGQLQYLQTLDIRGHDIVVPNVLWKLKRLRHLYLDFSHITRKGKLSFFGLSTLETLVGFDKDKDDFKDVSKLSNLRRLNSMVYIREKNEVSEILNYLNSKQHNLREVQLSISYFDSQLKEEEKIFPIKDFFTCLSLHQFSVYGGKFEFQKVEPLLFLSNLNDLSLLECEIQGDPMDFLGKLSNLKKLRLHSADLVDRKMLICDANAFPKLLSLTLYSVSKLESWVVAKGSVPNLSDLAITHCLKLKMIPDGLRYVRTLKKLDILMPKKFNQRIRGPDNHEGVDYDKISHVPLITLAVYYLDPLSESSDSTSFYASS